LHLANGKLYFELLEILSAAQNDLPFQGQKRLRSRRLRRIILDNECCFKILCWEMGLLLFSMKFNRFENFLLLLQKENANKHHVIAVSTKQTA